MVKKKEDGERTSIVVSILERKIKRSVFGTFFFFSWYSAIRGNKKNRRGEATQD